MPPVSYRLLDSQDIVMMEYVLLLAIHTSCERGANELGLLSD